jgi:hypothetical protein
MGAVAERFLQRFIDERLPLWLRLRSLLQPCQKVATASGESGLKR